MSECLPHTHACAVGLPGARGIKSLELELQICCEPSCKCQELNQDPREEPQMSSLRSHKCVNIFCSYSCPCPLLHTNQSCF